VYSWTNWIKHNTAKIRDPNEEAHIQEIIGLTDGLGDFVDELPGKVDQEFENGFHGQEHYEEEEDPFGTGPINLDGTDATGATNSNWRVQVNVDQEINRKAISDDELRRKIQTMFPDRRWNVPPPLGAAALVLDVKPNDDTYSAPRATVTETQAVLWWLQNTPFGPRHDKGAQGVMLHDMQTTYGEIAIAVELDTGACLGGHKADFADRAKQTANIIKHLVTTRKGRIGDDADARSFSAIFHPRRLRCARAVTDCIHTGIARRPVAAGQSGRNCHRHQSSTR
jgi:hypothetical protein